MNNIINKKEKHMKAQNEENENETRVRLTITLDNDFYQIIKDKAESDYLKVATFIKQHLKQSLLPNNTDVKCFTENEKSM